MSKLTATIEHVSKVGDLESVKKVEINLETNQYSECYLSYVMNELKDAYRLLDEEAV